jgi:succinate dehydrogenase / fumarate reductase, cytochrome b subunit
MAQSSARPLSPHLSIWKMGIHMFVSIANRIMGFGLATVGVIGLVWWLSAAAAGDEAYLTFMTWAQSWIGYIVLIGLTYAFFFHLCGGLRHFVMDIGAGFELRANRVWAWATLGAPIIFTMLTWFIILLRGFSHG